MAINSTADAIRAVASGQKPDSGASETGTGIGETSPESYDDSESVARAEESTALTDSFQVEGDDKNNPVEDSTESKETTDSSVEANSDGTPKTSSKEVLIVTDDKGRRRVEVDFNNREQLKKYVQMAHGARKWQAEKDQATQALKSEREERQKLQDNFNVLDSVYKKQGIEGLVDLLEGRQGAHKDYEKRVSDKMKFLERASPEEIEAYNFKQESEKIRRENQEIKEQNEKFKKEVTEERDQAEMRAMESRVHPVFDKYRFADKLGDQHDEHLFDEMLWNSSLKRLEPYEEQGLDITPELIEREFKAVATSIRRQIGKQAEKKTTRAIEQKKKEATENVQAKVMSGYKSNDAAKEANDLLNKGDTMGFLKNFGKYKGFLGSKK